NVAALTEGVLKSMLLTKLKTAVAVLLAGLGFGGGLGAAGPPHMGRAAPGTPDRAAAEDGQEGGTAGAADDKTGERPVLSGTWSKKDRALKVEFADKSVMKIAPHGDSAVLAIVCDYAVEKEGLVKAKVTGFEGKGEAKKHIEERLPVGLN